MIRATLPASAALSFALCATAMPALAVPCTTPAAGTFVCTAIGSDPVSSNVAGANVTVEDDASVVSDDNTVTPIELNGDGASVTNDGLVEQSSTMEDGYAITGGGDGLTVTNRGTIRSGDRGIEMLSGSNLTVINEAGATIESRRQGVRSEEDVPGARIENAGTISAEEGRAVQVRSFGATVINSGELIGGEEVLEARGDFTLENSGTIRLNDETVPDEDGVQFANGTVTNSGTIRGTDDGIDVDEGTITNQTGGVILSLAPDDASNSGIDVDAELDDEGITPIRPAGPLVIGNAGLIEGPVSIGTDDASTSEITIENTGTLRGRGGTAIRLAPDQGDSTLSLATGSIIEGDVLFGGGDDTVSVAAGFAGSLADGIVDGGAGSDTVAFEALVLEDLVSVTGMNGLLTLSLMGDAGTVEGGFRNFETFVLGGEAFSVADLEDTISTIPLPGALPLLAIGLGGLFAFRRA